MRICLHTYTNKHTHTHTNTHAHTHAHANRTHQGVRKDQGVLGEHHVESPSAQGFG